jgi:hypothetical protein
MFLERITAGERGISPRSAAERLFVRNVDEGHIAGVRGKTKPAFAIIVAIALRRAHSCPITGHPVAVDGRPPHDRTFPMPPKTASKQRPEFALPAGNGIDRIESLRNKRMLEEQAKKDAGIWGEVSVGVIERADAAFVLTWKGAQHTDMFKLAAKKPKEVSAADYEALCAWLKAGRYADFKSIISAWNVSADEADRLKKEMIAALPERGLRAVNT